MGLFRRRREEAPATTEATPLVRLTEERLEFHRPSGLEAIPWEGIETIAILGTEDGPAEDVFFVFSDVEMTQGCVVPQALMPEELLDWVLGLPGFDHDAMSRSMARVDEHRTVVWLKP